MNDKNCPVCGRPLSALDALLAEHDHTFQCRHCWSVVHLNGAAQQKFAAPAPPLRARAARTFTRLPRKKR